MIKISKAVEKLIRQSAVEEYPKEACGVLTKQGKKLLAVKCVNISDEPTQRFVISTEEYRKHLDSCDVYGIWHTHVNEPPQPSETDIAACNATGVDWFILSISKDEFNSISFSELVHLAPKDVDDAYLERPYIYGIKDCFTLVRDYYRREFNIEILHRADGYPEVSDWQSKGLNLLSDHYKKAGFVNLGNLEPQIGDLFLIQMSTAATDHIAIYIGNDRILHHCMGRLSTEDIYGGGYWQKHTTASLRWSGFVEGQE